MYVRFGEAPASGRSWNTETDTAEAGVSCYRAYWQDDEQHIISISVPDEGSMAQINMLLADRPLYLIKGDEIGAGSDGEPVLAATGCTELDTVEVIYYCVEN